MCICPVCIYVLVTKGAIPGRFFALCICALVNLLFSGERGAISRACVVTPQLRYSITTTLTAGS